MNKQRSMPEQFLHFFVIAFASWWLFNTFFKPQTNVNTVPARTALPVAQAFKGIDPKQGPAETKVQAIEEIKTLRAEIDKNPADERSYWNRLRVALLQQYVLGNLEQQTRASGFLWMGPKLKYFPAYEEIVSHMAGDAIDAQANYQTGDLLWRRSIQNGGQPAQEAAQYFESMLQKGRTSTKFLEQQIMVPEQADPAKVPVDGVPAEGFRLATVDSLRGSVNDNGQGILSRVNRYYSDKPLFRLLDSVVNLLGNNPRYSVGLALVFFAVALRFLVQPLTKRQYDSMKGMAVIGPEMKKIQEHYKGKTEPDAQVKMMKEIRELQQRHGVNPAVGCGFALLQAPIFLVFVYPLIQNYVAKMELTGASFLWIQSLARNDIPLLVLYGLSQFLSARLSMTAPTDDMQRQQQIIMSFVFPLIFPFFMLSYPSAFILFWMTYNTVNTVFQWRMMKVADPKRNVIKTLMGADLKVVNSNKDAVPSRPGSEIVVEKKTEPKSLESGDGLSNGTNGVSKNGSANNGSNGNGNNGHTNGKAKSSPNGIVLTPLDGGNKQTPKKKRKR